MAELEQAAERLQGALERLEAAVERRQETAGAEPDDAELRAALAQAQQENQDLQKLAGEVSSHLDGLILRLKTWVES